MHVHKTRGDISELGGLLMGAAGRGSTRATNDRIENKMVAIQECRADLQNFLQRTRSRLQAIADNVNDCFENLADVQDASRILRGADGSQALKPLPIMSPAVQRFSDDINVSVTEDAKCQMFNTRSNRRPLIEAECSEADWKVSNAFDRNTYYGPTDFAHMPDDSEYPELACADSHDELFPSDDFCTGTLPIASNGNQPFIWRKHRSSRLHLANQIRHN